MAVRRSFWWCVSTLGAASLWGAQACGSGGDDNLFGASADAGSDSSGSGGTDGGSGGAGGAAGGAAGGPPSNCKSDKDCTPLGLLCDRTLGECVECVDDRACTGDERCIGGVCEEPETCTNSLDCPAGRVCDRDEGVCVQCLTNADCDDGRICVNNRCRDDGSGGAGGGAGAGGGGGSDADGDGFTKGGGDCDDGDANVNPGAYDYPGDGKDDDCSGKADDEVTSCSPASTAIDSNDAIDGARAMGICKTQAGRSWGLVSAAYVLADGSTGIADLSHGILTQFGPVRPREGDNMLALSSGTARGPMDPGYQAPSGANMSTTSPLPMGFPVSVPACTNPPTGTQAFDPAALEVTVRAPTNARAFTVDFDFHAFDFPSYVCGGFNDLFVVLAEPPPAGAISNNVAFDSMSNPVSIASAELIRVCDSAAAGLPFPFACPLGTTELAGTGFDTAAATGWTRTTARVEPGQEVTLRFAVWDEADSIQDSTVLLDRFSWVRSGPSTPKTEPAP